LAFALAAGDKKDFEDAFRPPFDWSRRREEEALRGWQTLDASPRALHLMHGTGAVAMFTWDGDRVTAVALLEGAQAEAVVRRLGFPAPKDLQRRVRKAFRIGRPVDEAAAAAFRQPVAQLPPRDGLRWYRSPEGALVEVQVEDGRVSGVALRTGGAALDVLQAAAVAATWAVPEHPGPVLAARTLAEVRLFVAVARGTWVEARTEGDLYVVLAHLPEGRRRIRFSVTDPSDGPDTAFGPGTSRILDPAELLLFGERVGREASAATAALGAARVRDELRLAAAAVREAARFAGPSGAPPRECFLTPAARSLFDRQPARFTPDALHARGAALDAQADALREAADARPAHG
jgi:hypothetical protein